MNIFGIGPLEILLVLVLALILFGPQDLQKTGKMLGQTLNKIIRSDAWRMLKKTGSEINRLPQRLMKETELNDVKENLQKELAGTSNELGKNAEVLSPVSPIQPPTAPASTASEPGSQKSVQEAGVIYHA